MLNSNNLENSVLGVVDEDKVNALSLDRVHNTKYYDDLSSCIYDLTISKVNSCLHLRNDGSGRKIDIYLDNTKQAIEYYIKQSISQSVLEDQSSEFQKTADEVNSRLTVYSTSIKDSRDELDKVEKELEEQRQILLNYRQNLTQVRSDFNSVYYPLKSMEPYLETSKTSIQRNNEALKQNISHFRNKKSEIQNTVYSLKSYLQPKLAPEEYNYVSTKLDSILADLNSIDLALYNIEGDYAGNQLISMIENMQQVIKKLDSIKALLDKTDSDLNDALQKIQNSRDRVYHFKNKLNDAANDIEVLSQSISKEGVELEFLNAFNLSNDPVILVYPILIAIIITFTSLVLSNMFILRQVNKASYLKDLITPTKDINFILADYLINLFFIAIQAAILFLLGLYWFDVSQGVLYIFIFSLFLSSSIFIFVGMAIGYIIRSTSLSMLLTIFLVMLLFIFSDLIVSSVLAGPIVKFFIGLNPFVILTNILVDSMLLRKEFYFFVFNLSKLALLFISSFIIAYLAKKISREDSVE